MKQFKRAAACLFLFAMLAPPALADAQQQNQQGKDKYGLSQTLRVLVQIVTGAAR